MGHTVDVNENEYTQTPFDIKNERRCASWRSDLFSSFRIPGGFELRGFPQLRQRGFGLPGRCSSTSPAAPFWVRSEIVVTSYSTKRISPLFMERETGFEPATSSLGTSRMDVSTTT